jgi:hypothetical protein
MKANQLVVPLVPDVVKEGVQGAVETVVPVALLNPSAITKQAAFENVHGCIIYSVVRLLSEFAEHVNNKAFYFVAVEKRHKDRANKCNH